MTLESLFETVEARSEAYVQEHLNDHHLDESRVGDTKDVLDHVGDTSHLSLHLRGI